MLESLKMSVARSIFKKGDTSAVIDYKRISFVTDRSKVFEKFLKVRINVTYQSGFKLHSIVEDAIFTKLFPSIDPFFM